MITTYTFWNSFRNCRRACEWRYLNNLVPLSRDQRLAFGSLIHSCLKIWHGGGGLDGVLDFIDKSLPNRPQDESRKAEWHLARAMMTGYVARYPVENFEIVSLETVFGGKIINPATRASSRSFTIAGNLEHVGGTYDAWEVRDGRNRVWAIVADSSLSNVPANLRAEVVSPILTYDGIPEFQEVIRSVRKCGAQVDEKCGLHVHVGTENFDGRALINLAKTFYKYEPLIIAALGVNEQRLRHYIKPLSSEFIARLEKLRTRSKIEVNRAWYGQINNHPTRYCSSRYQTLNMNSVWFRGTVEFRMAEASLHAGKVKATIQFCLALCAKALNSRSASSRKREFDPTSAKYDMRVLMIHLQMVGPDFATARKHILALMPGDAAFKRGRKKKSVGERRDG